MQTITATEAKNNLATLIEKAMRKPVAISKNGRPVVVMMSMEAYEAKEKNQGKEAFVKLCDELAATAERNGMTEEILKSILAEDE